QHGDIFGGWIMAQVDIAGGVMAARRALGRVATVAVNSFTFKQPVLVGDVVSFYGRIARVGRTSLSVDVEVYAQRNPTELVTVKVTEASLTYVAVGEDRRPRPIPER
ncbi:MAG TPA: acyl-CoA thioesterase, partial [Casimicrobiaceae bacterium]|nr:acyl-CoA thioesterase [Casimicrobiaceae bacterium]